MYNSYKDVIPIVPLGTLDWYDCGGTQYVGQYAAAHIERVLECGEELLGITSLNVDEINRHIGLYGGYIRYGWRLLRKDNIGIQKQ